MYIFNNIHPVLCVSTKNVDGARINVNTLDFNNVS